MTVFEEAADVELVLKVVLVDPEDCAELLIVVLELSVADWVPFEDEETVEVVLEVDPAVADLVVEAF